MLKANYEQEVEKLKSMMPKDEQSSSQDNTVVDTGLLFYLLTHIIMPPTMLGGALSDAVIHLSVLVQAQNGTF